MVSINLLEGGVGTDARAREGDTRKMADLEVASLVNRACKIATRKRYKPNEATHSTHLTHLTQVLQEK